MIQPIRVKHALCPLALSLAAAIVSNGASAQAKLEEVIVTAQKRAESLQDVPVAVTAIDGQKLDDYGLTRLDDLMVYTPSLTVVEGPADSFIFIRGIGSGFNKGFEQSVGTYVDGIYFGRGRSSRNGMVDMERVEVLKGPQGILFGKNTIAGAINLTTRNPSQEAEGYIQISNEFEETDETSIEAAYGGYLTDTFGIRLATRYTTSNGWMTNTYNGEQIGAEDDVVTRLSMVFEPNDDVKVTAKVQHSHLEQSEKPSELVVCNAGMQGILGMVGIDDCSFDGNTSVSAIDPKGGFGGDNMEALSGSLNIDWAINDSLTLTSLTGYTTHDEDMYLDADYSPLELLDATRDEYFKSVSQEFRINSQGDNGLDYIAGVYIESSTMDFDAILSYNLAAIPLVGSRVTDVTQDTDTKAIFGQMTWQLNDDLAVTVGARYSEDKKDVDSVNYCGDYKTGAANGAAGCFGPAYAIVMDRKDDNFSPAVTLEWNPSIDHMLYAKYSEGYKSGGFDLQSTTGNLDTFQFEPEEAKSFELGSKSTLMDGAMTLNAALFRNEYTNLQVSTFDGNVSFNVGNAAKAISQGIDLDVNWALTDSLRTSLSVAILDATYDSFATAQCSFPETAAGNSVCDLTGTDLQFSPEWSGHWNVSWESSVADDMLLTVSSDLNFTDSFQTMSDNDPELVQGAFAKLDMRVSLQPSDGQWELALIGRNLTDEETFHFGNDVPLSGGSYFKNYEKPRTVAIQGRLRF